MGRWGEQLILNPQHSIPNLKLAHPKSKIERFLVKDNISLIAAVAGGLMLSVALSGILRGTPVTTWQEQSHLNSQLITCFFLPVTPHTSQILTVESQL